MSRSDGPSEGKPLAALIEYLARSMVDDPTEVRVTETQRRGEILLELEVAPGDMGRVIGRSGRVASAMRSLLRVAAVRRGVRANLDIR